MTDKELLELAAKAAGIGDANFLDCINGYVPCNYDETGEPEWWNPLTDDGDALRLAVKLNMGVNFDEEKVGANCGRGAVEILGNDPYAATRRAIVRAAAEIGKEMK